MQRFLMAESVNGHLMWLKAFTSCLGVKLREGKQTNVGSYDTPVQIRGKKIWDYLTHANL